MFWPSKLAGGTPHTVWCNLKELIMQLIMFCPSVLVRHTAHTFWWKILWCSRTRFSESELVSLDILTSCLFNLNINLLEMQYFRCTCLHTKIRLHTLHFLIHCTKCFQSLKTVCLNYLDLICKFHIQYRARNNHRKCVEY